MMNKHRNIQAPLTVLRQQIKATERYGSLYHTLLCPENGAVEEYHASPGSRSVPESCGTGDSI